MRGLFLCVLLVGCGRERRVEVTPVHDVPSAVPSTSASVAKEAAPEPVGPSLGAGAEPPDPAPKLVPFLSDVPAVASAPATSPAFLHAPPPKFDVRKGKVFHLADGDLYGASFDNGASDSWWVLSLVRGGVEVKRFPQVSWFNLDRVHDRMVFEGVQVEASGPVGVRELVDLTTWKRTPMPRMPCTNDLVFVDDGNLLLGNGFVHDYSDHPESSQVWVCLFDASGKLLTKLDGGRHNHHAASNDYVRSTAGVLPKDPFVVWLTREYRPYGNFDVTFFDTRSHAFKVARLNTPAKPGELADVEMDLSTMTLATATEVRFRGKKLGEGWFWKWQSAKLRP